MNDTKPALPEPIAYLCPKNGKLMSVLDYAKGMHLEGPMRGHYEAIVFQGNAATYADQCTAAAQARIAEMETAIRRILEEPSNTMSDGKALKEIVRIARAALAPTSGAAHTDHPVRHWDRTCPACIAEPPLSASMFASLTDYKAAIKERQAASPPVVQPEAVATLHDDGSFTWKRDEFRLKYDRQRAGWRMDVYASPPPAELKTLSDEEIKQIGRESVARWIEIEAGTQLHDFARAIERALAEKNGAKNAS